MNLANNQKIMSILNESASTTHNNLVSQNSNIEMITDDIAAAVMELTVPTHYHTANRYNPNNSSRHAVAGIDETQSPLVQFRPISA